MGTLKPEHPRRFAKGLLDCAASLWEHEFVRTALEDASAPTSDEFVKGRVTAKLRYCLGVVHSTSNLRSALRRAGVALALESYQPRGCQYTSIGLDVDELEQFYRTTYMVQLVSVVDCALHLTNRVLQCGIEKCDVRWKSVYGMVANTAGLEPLAKSLDRIHKSAVAVRPARDSHVHAGEEPEIDTESLMRSTRRLLRSLGAEQDGVARWRTEMWEWNWQQCHRERLKPTVVAVQRFLTELLPRYVQIRDSLAGQ